MRIAILGATGQLGRDVVRAVEGRAGFDPVVLGRDTVDLDDPEGIRPPLGAADFDVLINCAAYTDVDGAESEPAAAFRRNAWAVEEIALGCAAAEARLIQVSTDYVFDGEASRPYRPDDAPAPINVYGASKLAGEALARRACGRTLVVRTSSVFGTAGARRPGGNFVETMLRLSRERDRLTVVSEGAMTPTYTGHLAEALLDLLDAGAEPGTYHITNRGTASWYDFAAAIVEAAGRGVAVDPVGRDAYPTAARRPLYSVLDTAKADAWIGRLPGWRDALGQYLSARDGDA